MAEGILYPLVLITKPHSIKASLMHRVVFHIYIYKFLYGEIFLEIRSLLFVCTRLAVHTEKNILVLYNVFMKPWEIYCCESEQIDLNLLSV